MGSSVVLKRPSNQMALAGRIELYSMDGGGTGSPRAHAKSLDLPHEIRVPNAVWHRSSALIVDAPDVQRTDQVQYAAI
jgi:hypothetical protein